jgi:hypothetical protein
VIDKLVKATFDQATSGTYEAEVRRAEERVLVTGSNLRKALNAQVRAIAAPAAAACDSSESRSGRTEGDLAQHTLMAADIKRPRAPDGRCRWWPDHAAVTAARRPDRRHGPDWLARPPLQLGRHQLRWAALPADAAIRLNARGAPTSPLTRPQQIIPAPAATVLNHPVRI